MVFRLPMCNIRTCTICNLVICLVERGTDGTHVSLVLDKIVIIGDYVNVYEQLYTCITQDCKAIWLNPALLG